MVHSMESFDKRYYENELMQDGRKVYAQVLIAADLCEVCHYPIITKPKLWAVAGLFAREFGLVKQMRRSGWRYRHQDTGKCEACAQRINGFTCALCGMDRKPEEVAHSFGERDGWMDRICRSCDETQPGILLQRKINELRGKHAALERDDDTGDDDEAEESESDMGGSPGRDESDGQAGG